MADKALNRKTKDPVWNQFQHLESELQTFYTLRSNAFNLVAEHYKEVLNQEGKWMVELINQIPRSEVKETFYGEDAIFKNFIYDMKNRNEAYVINFMLFPNRTCLSKHYKMKPKKIPYIVKKSISKFGKKFNRLLEVVEFDSCLAIKVGKIK